MVVVTVQVPARQAPLLVRTLLMLYRVKAEALYLATDAYLNDPELREQLLAHRRELSNINRLIDQAGWTIEPQTTSRTLTGDPSILEEITEGTLIDVLETAQSSLTQSASPAPTSVTGLPSCRSEHRFRDEGSTQRPRSQQTGQESRCSIH